ncbi:MAG TPA: response regulator transcription factor [Opitutaceae bacterium]|nr:response regulator transcription factor [Opitutaceae bacterium]
MTPSAVRVFIVDDHPLVREWLATTLRQQPDLDVCGQAEDAASGLAAMLANPPDVAIVDLSLKTSSGLDLIKDLTEHLPGTQIIVLSMHEELFYAERALRAGARGYVMKRESTDRVVEAIRAVQTGRIYANPQLLARLTERLMGKRQETPSSGVELLSDRELDVFRRLGEGQATRRIAAEMHVSIKTVQAYCARIKEKLQLASGAELVREAVRWTERKNRS